jgi:hypothetical protein
MESLLELFVHVDEFCKAFMPKLERQLLSSVTSFLVNLLCGLIAYACQPKIPSLGRETLVCFPT